MKYKIIYADPPWSFNNKNTGGGLNSGASAHYEVMTIDDICKLPIKEIADDDCVLFMWWVASMPVEALKVVESWGFEVKTMSGFNWVKTTNPKFSDKTKSILWPSIELFNKHGISWFIGKLFFGMGFWTRAGSELCLIAVKGKPKRISGSVRSVVIAKIGKHSQKPNIFRKKILELMGDLPRVELFAREQLEGFDVYGNEVENSIKL